MIFLENGIGDYFTYAAIENQKVAVRLLELYQKHQIGTAYPDCGWNEVPRSTVPNHINPKLITDEVLDSVLKKAEESGEDFDYHLINDGYLIEDED